MTTFNIDAENHITAFASSEQIEESGGETFTNQRELAERAGKWPTARLVAIWNSLPGVEPVQRFTSRPVAVTRIWKAIQGLAPGGERKPSVAVQKSTARKQTRATARKRAGGRSKAERVIALLERPQGATLEAIVRATGWQTHSVRGFISGHLKKKLRLKVRSVKREGERVYSIKP